MNVQLDTDDIEVNIQVAEKLGFVVEETEEGMLVIKYTDSNSYVPLPDYCNSFKHAYPAMLTIYQDLFEINNFDCLQWKEDIAGENKIKSAMIKFVCSKENTGHYW